MSEVKDNIRPGLGEGWIKACGGGNVRFECQLITLNF